MLSHFKAPNKLIQDPFLPTSYNRFAYVGYEPIAHTDPSGYCAVKKPGKRGEVRNENDADCWAEYDALTALYREWGYDPLTFLGSGRDWNYTGVSLYPGDVLEEYFAFAEGYREAYGEIPVSPLEFYQAYVFTYLYEANPHILVDAYVKALNR